MFSNKKFNIALLFALVIILLIIGISLGQYLNQQNLQQNSAAPSDYSAVYLVTGDIYFGKLSWFPWPHLDNVWFIRNNQNQLSVAPLTGAFWGPINRVYLNPKNIILWTNLRQDSQLFRYFSNPSLFQQQAQQQQQPSLPTSTSSGKP